MYYDPLCSTTHLCPFPGHCLVLCVCVCVCMDVMMTYVHCIFLYLCKTADDTRQLLTLYDPDLGKPLPERTYAEDCRLVIGHATTVVYMFRDFMQCARMYSQNM